MAAEAVSSRREGDVVVLTPGLGAGLEPEVLLAELVEAVEAAQGDARCRALLIELEGDPPLRLDRAEPGSVVDHARSVQSLLEGIARGRKPAVAALLSDCCSTGLDLALACHVTVASDDLQLGPPEREPSGFGARQRLLRLAGRERTMLFFVSSEPTPVERLAPDRWPAVLEPAADCRARALEIASSLAELEAAGMEDLLESLHAGEDLPLDDALELEAQLAGLLAARTRGS